MPDQIKKIYSFWGRHPLLYAFQDPVTFLGRAGFIRKRAVEKLRLRKGAKVLEIACGTGRNFSFLVEAVGPRGRLVGADLSPEMLASTRRLAAKKGWLNIKLIRGDAARLKIGGKDFDGILSVLGLSAVPGWEKALLRCKEVLKPGGRLCVCDARPFDGFLRLLNPLVKTIYSRFAAWDPSKNIPAKMEEMFGNVSVEYFNFGSFFIAVSTKKKPALRPTC